MDYTELTTEQLIDRFRAFMKNKDFFEKIKSSCFYPNFIKIMSDTCNQLNFYTQRAAEERLIDTSKIKSNVIKHCENLGYGPRRPIPAQAELIIQLKGPFPAEINKPGTEIFFNQNTVDLSFSDMSFILDSSYSYVLTNEDITYCHEPDWQKNLINAVPHTNSVYMPLQGMNFVNSENVTAIKCFQGERVTYKVEGQSVLNKIGKPRQFFNIPDKTFSNWYGERDPYAYNGDRNYVQKNSWCQVGIGETEEDALSDENIFDIETHSIKLNKKYRKISPETSNIIKQKLYEIISHQKNLDVNYFEQQMKEIVALQLRICKITTNPDETVKVSFGHDHNVVNGLMKADDNFYIRYISTNGKAANRKHVVNANMTVKTPIYASVNGNVIDISANVSFILNSDIYGGDDFESIASMKVNGPAYYTRRNKLIMLPDFENYFGTLTAPMYVHHAYASGQQEFEKSQITAKEYPLLQNVISYSLIGRLYIKNDGDYYPRDILNDDDISEPYTLYGAEYLNHITDYVKFLISPVGYYHHQYAKNPTEQWIRNVQLIRENCKDNLPVNSTILSLPPFLHYYDLVGTVRVNSTANLQEYNTRMKNKVYKFLDDSLRATKKVYKADIIKLYTDDPDTLSIDADIKVSDVIKSPELEYEWSNQMNNTTYVAYLDKTLQTYTDAIAEYNATHPSSKLVNGADITWMTNPFNVIQLPKTDLYGKQLFDKTVNGINVKLTYSFYGKNTKTTYHNTVMTHCNATEFTDENNNTFIRLELPMVYQSTPRFITTNPAGYELVYTKLVIPSYNDLASTSQLDSLKINTYKLKNNTDLNNIKSLVKQWLEHGRLSRSAERAIRLPYRVTIFNDDTDAREEEIMRKGNIIGEHDYTISEASFWNYIACEKIIKQYYPDIDEYTHPTNEYWVGASQLLYDLYVLVKASIDDSVLDDNNNITNFSLEQEGAVVINKLNVIQY